MATIKARKEELRALIDEQEFDVPFNGEDVQRMNALTGWFFPMYKRIYNPHYPNDTRCVAHSDNGEQWVVWSWNKAVSKRNDLHEALRKSVRQQIAAYSAIAENECAKCGSQEFLTIDHKSIPFSHLVAHLTRMFPGLYDALANAADGSGWYIKDKELEWVWQDLHKNNADYQVLCRSCNASKGARNGNA